MLCKFCGGVHKPRECCAYGQKCHKCKKRNHWRSSCMTKNRHEASTKYVDNFVIEVIKAKQKQKEKSTEVFAKLCRYDGTNIPVEGKIKAMCEYGEN